jgi:aryl-alcohol dehydrogenase-like predicted oxidoreductase
MYDAVQYKSFVDFGDDADETDTPIVVSLRQVSRFRNRDDIRVFLSWWEAGYKIQVYLVEVTNLENLCENIIWTGCFP